MSKFVRYTCTAYMGVNDASALTVDADGYREIIVGGIGVHNASGDFYDEQAARQFFDTDPDFQRRITRGLLKGELGHPKMTPGMKDYEYINRLMQMEETNICAHHHTIAVSTEMIKDGEGRAFFPILAKTIPSGSQGHVLERSFQNPKENIAFSIRSFTKDVPYPGRPGRSIKALAKVLGFDQVSEPGLLRSTAMDTMNNGMGISMEGLYQPGDVLPSVVTLEEELFTMSTLSKAAQRERAMAMGNESNLPVNELYSSMVDVAPTRIFVPNLPASMSKKW